MTNESSKPVPSGIEYLVSLAASDPKFRERLLSDRLKAAKRAGVRLTGSEKTLLLAIPDEQLRQTIDNAKPMTGARRGFLRKAGLWAAGLFGGVTMATMTGCPVATKGAEPDVPEQRTMGIQPDVPPTRVDSAGERPDVPPAKDEAGEDPGPVTGARPELPNAKGE